MRQNVLSIPPGLPFLRTLAHSVLTDALDVGFHHEGDPLELADLLIYVPGRRAARSLAFEFQNLLGGGATILPEIRPIGEGDEAELLQIADGASALMPTMGELERRLELARLVRQWRTMTREAELRALMGEEIALPASAADAIYLAGDLGRLLDEIETEGVPFSGLGALAPEDLAEWWRLTLTFLTIVTRHWPERLEADGRTSEAAARNEWLRGEAARLRNRPPAGPVILAGSTATAPAPLDLMRAVAALERGAVVLPGLDRDLDDGAFDAIDRSLSIAAPGHPQYGLKRIVQTLTIDRGAIRPLGEPTASLRARERFLSEAMRPAETTERWSEAGDEHVAEALAAVELIEAADPREEALAIACAMRDALEEPNATCALITPDRNLARRTVVELERFGIRANDSAGRPLAASAPGTLAATLLSVAFAPGDPIPLLALLKHPLTRLGMKPAEARRAARAIELLALRGTVDIADGARLATIVAQRMQSLGSEDEENEAGGTTERPRLSRPARLVSKEDRRLALDYAEAFAAAIAPLVALRGEEARELPDYAIALTGVLEAFGRDESGRPRQLYAEEAGKALEDFLADLVAAPQTGFAFPASELGDVVEALMAGITVRPRGGLSSRAFVWGALESRLQRVDTAILGGLNEGAWPGGATSGAFLSRIMRRDLALDPPERRIGLAAHDFWMACGTPRLVLSRSLRADGAATIASRWVQRMLALAGPARAGELGGRGEVYLAAARRFGAVPAIARARRPEPKPPVELRPRQFSVTEVERLIRDPYTVHAARILKLEPLDPLMRSPDAKERGTLYHAILADYARSGADPMAQSAEADLLAIAREHFDKQALPSEIEAFWWPRMEAIAKGYVEWERLRDAEVTRRHVEIGGRISLPVPAVDLTGYADRIDVMKDGSLQIIDFKTGTSPSVKQAQSLLAPQLPLEGGMASRNGFADLRPANGIGDLLYVRLREREVRQEGLAKAESRKGGDAVDPDELSHRAIEKFERLTANLLKPETPFISRFRPAFAGDFTGDYDHLARAREWAVAGGETEGAGEE